MAAKTKMPENPKVLSLEYGISTLLDAKRMMMISHLGRRLKRQLVCPLGHTSGEPILYLVLCYGSSIR